MLTSIIIPTVFNDFAVRRAIDCIKANTYSDYELIVMDNGSTARGCVHATNQGLAAADGEVLVCMNDDCQPTEGWLEPMIEAIERGVWLCCPQWKYARIAGHCMVFNRKALKLTGGFDERYRHWNADHHFEMLVAKHSAPIQQVTTSIVHHQPDDIGRIHHRKSAFLGNHDELPNTGEWYNIDNKLFHEIWQGDVPENYWPEGWAEGAVSS